TTAIVTAIVLASVAAIANGIAVAHFTGRTWYFSAARSLAICAVAGAVTYGIGSLIGAKGATSR
ncbi:MAG TPA: hypothetical protein VG368_07710, partial [Acidimicrobiales bacterium]|nr:hypothetical protein [Acidimicrobiales bacterium]